MFGSLSVQTFCVFLGQLNIFSLCHPRSTKFASLMGMCGDWKGAERKCVYEREAGIGEREKDREQPNLTSLKTPDARSKEGRVDGRCTDGSGRHERDCCLSRIFLFFNQLYRLFQQILVLELFLFPPVPGSDATLSTQSLVSTC